MMHSMMVNVGRLDEVLAGLKDDVVIAVVPAVQIQGESFSRRGMSLQTESVILILNRVREM